MRMAAGIKFHLKFFRIPSYLRPAISHGGCGSVPFNQIFNSRARTEESAKDVIWFIIPGAQRIFHFDPALFSNYKLHRLYFRMCLRVHSAIARILNYLVLCNQWNVFHVEAPLSSGVSPPCFPRTRFCTRVLRRKLLSHHFRFHRGFVCKVYAVPLWRWFHYYHFLINNCDAGSATHAHRSCYCLLLLVQSRPCIRGTRKCRTQSDERHNAFPIPDCHSAFV